MYIFHKLYKNSGYHTSNFTPIKIMIMKNKQCKTNIMCGSYVEKNYTGFQ
jgi:hypothetical protein